VWRRTALTERQVSTRATPCVGYWAAYYINREGGWSVACDALGRIIRCETEELALSVARYRRRRLQPFRGSPDLAERQHGRISVGGGLLFTQQFEGSPELPPPRSSRKPYRRIVYDQPFAA
jgi:hypothetical protein